MSIVIFIEEGDVFDGMNVLQQVGVDYLKLKISSPKDLDCHVVLVTPSKSP